MKLFNLVLCFVIIVSVVEQVSCNVEEYLRELPNKIKNAFGGAWNVLKKTFGQSGINRRHKRTRTTVAITSLTTREPDEVKKSILRLPFLPAPRSKYQYMWRVPPVTYQYNNPGEEHQATHTIKTLPTSPNPTPNIFKKIVRLSPQVLERPYDFEHYYTTPPSGLSIRSVAEITEDSSQMVAVNLIRLNKTVFRLITKWELKME